MLKALFYIIISVIMPLLNHSWIIPGSFLISWEVYNPGCLIGAHQHLHHRSPLFYTSWVKRSEEKHRESFLYERKEQLSCSRTMTQVPQPAWLGFEPTFWRLGHQNPCPVLCAARPRHSTLCTYVQVYSTFKLCRRPIQECAAINSYNDHLELPVDCVNLCEIITVCV